MAILTWKALWIYLAVAAVLCLFGLAVTKVFFLKSYEDFDSDNIAPSIILSVLWPIAIPIGLVAGSMCGVYWCFLQLLTAFKHAFVDNGCEK